MVDSIASGDLASIQSRDDSRSSLSRQGLAENFDNFLVLLTTQLKNQDPTDPLDANQFTEQLVSFTGVEQQINANENLEQLISLTQSNQLNNAVGYLGKLVEVEGSVAKLNNGADVTFAYELSEKTSNTSIIISNEFGQAVFTTEGKQAPGKHEIIWDGTDNTGQKVSDGNYKITVGGLDADGNLVDVKTYVTDVVEGVTLEDGTPLLTLSTGVTKELDKISSVQFQSIF